MKNKTQLDGMPVWFDGKSINEALFCEEFLQTHKIIFTNGAFFTPEGRVTDELPLRGEIFEELKCCAVSNIPRKISNIVELMKLAALVEDFPPEPDRIHLSNGTLFLDGTFAKGKPKIVRNRFPVSYKPNAPKPVLWLQFLDGLLYPEDIPTLQEYTWICSSWRSRNTISSSFLSAASACTSAAMNDTCWRSTPRPTRRNSSERQVVADGCTCGNRKGRRLAPHQ